MRSFALAPRLWHCKVKPARRGIIAETCGGFTQFGPPCRMRIVISTGAEMTMDGFLGEALSDQVNATPQELVPQGCCALIGRQSLASLKVDLQFHLNNAEARQIPFLRIFASTS